ncbi:unnamed protein product [Polarella glacialis]|uniref:Uncharacterized protein n=2 Tax=Polarella glacialis TaxID=89957 RepID=A0A813KM19_POLGL|nr:unnamed protein product [Polarella glacialis]
MDFVAAAKSKDAAACSAALKSGANPNAVDEDPCNYTALHLFAGQGDLAMCKILIAAGAQVDPRSSKDETPLIMAAQGKHMAVIEFLVEAGADRAAHTNYSTKTAQQHMESEPDCFPCKLQ